MGRPRKDGRLRMDSDIRIPLTTEQKALIVAATQDEPEGMAAWARAILLREARKRVPPDGGEVEEVQDRKRADKVRGRRDRVTD